MIEHLHAIRTRPVWQRAPDDLLARREAPLPKAGRGIAEVIEEFDELPKPMPQGSATRIHGVGAWRRNPAGMVADMLPAGLAVNCGGRSHSGIEIEKQITRWMKEAFGFPHRAPGLLVTGPPRQISWASSSRAMEPLAVMCASRDWRRATALCLRLQLCPWLHLARDALRHRFGFPASRTLRRYGCDAYRSPKKA